MRKLFNSKRHLNTYDGIAILSRAQFAIRNQIFMRDEEDYRAFDAAHATIETKLRMLPNLKEHAVGQRVSL
jgi:hypothetical protein